MWPAAGERLKPRSVRVTIQQPRHSGSVVRSFTQRVRVRIFFLSMDNPPPDNPHAIPILSSRVQNAFREFGNDWLKIAGLGARWCVDRFLALRETTLRDLRSHFHSYARR